MRMDEGLDTGPILMAERVPIGPETTGGALHDTLAALSARMVLNAVDALAAGGLAETPQPAEGATYAAKLEKNEAAIDWRTPAVRKSSARFAPSRRSLALGSIHEGERIKVLAAESAAGTTDAAPGTVLDDALYRRLRRRAPRCARPAFSAPARRRWIRTPFCAGGRSRPARACHAPLQADPRIRRHRLRRLAVPGRRALGAGGAGARGRTLLRRAGARARRGPDRFRRARVGPVLPPRSRPAGRAGGAARCAQRAPAARAGRRSRRDRGAA